MWQRNKLRGLLTTATEHSPTLFSMTSFLTRTSLGWGMTIISLVLPCTPCLVSSFYIPKTSSIGRISATVSTGSTSRMTSSGSRIIRKYMVRAFGHHAYGMPTDSSISIPTSTEKDSNATQARISMDHGPTTICRGTFMTSVFCLMTMGKYMPSMDMER